MHDLYTGIQFGRAVAAHLKLDGGKVAADVTVHSGSGEVFAVTLTVMLSPDDLVAIGNLMRGDAPKAEQYEALHVDLADGAEHAVKVPTKTSIGELTVKLDTSLVQDAIREMLEPGAMYLPKAAVLKLYSHFDIDVDLVDFGAIVAK